MSAARNFDGIIWKPTLRASWDHQYEGTRDVFSRLASLPQATIDTILPRGDGQDGSGMVRLVHQF